MLKQDCLVTSTSRKLIYDIDVHICNLHSFSVNTTEFLTNTLHAINKLFYNNIHTLCIMQLTIMVKVISINRYDKSITTYEELKGTL